MTDEERQDCSGDSAYAPDGDIAYARALAGQQLDQQREFVERVEEEERRRQEHRLFAAQIAAPHPTGAAAKRRPPKVPLSPAKRLQPRFNPLVDWANYVVIFLGGCLGTALRMWLGDIAPSASGFWGAFSVGTLVANVVACFLFSALVTFCAQAIWVRKRVRQLTGRAMGMGLCGAMSSMTTVMIENMLALQEGNYLGVFLYTLGSFVLGLAAAYVGACMVTTLTAERSVRAMTEVVFDAKPAIGVRVPMPAKESHHWWGVHSRTAPGEPDPDTDELPRVVRDSDAGHGWHRRSSSWYAGGLQRNSKSRRGRKARHGQDHDQDREQDHGQDKDNESWQGDNPFYGNPSYDDGSQQDGIPR